MKGSRIKDEVKEKILTEKINNPDITLKELKEKYNIPTSTSADVINNNLGKVCKSSENVAKLIDSNNNLISLADARLNELLQNGEEKISARDLVSIRESGFKQNLLLTPNSDGKEKEFIVRFEL